MAEGHAMTLDIRVDKALSYLEQGMYLVEEGTTFELGMASLRRARNILETVSNDPRIAILDIGDENQLDLFLNEVGLPIEEDEEEDYIERD